jgi:hypothetical protein
MGPSGPSREFLEAVKPASMAQVLAAAAEQRASENNVRVGPEEARDDDGKGARGGGRGGGPSGPSRRDEDFLRKVFQAFDQNSSGSISVLEVRALFDRVALEATLAEKGQASGDKTLKAATRFIAQLFDDDSDGKLGRSELDRFFQVFNTDDNKIISWDEFLFHGVRLLATYREKEMEEGEAKEHVPTREELKENSERSQAERERETKRAQRRIAGPPAAPSQRGRGAPSAAAKSKVASTPGSPPGRTAGLRSRSERPGFA